MLKQFVYIDFEYCKPQERHPDLVCAAWWDTQKRKMSTSWLYHNPRNQKKLHNILMEYKKQGFIFVAYAVTAEARCFQALKINPALCKWIDLYVEWRQLRNSYDKFNYGTYFIRNVKNRSVPPKYDRPSANAGRDNTQVPYSLDGCVARLFKKNIDSLLKKHMRELILTAPENGYTTDEEKDILEYCKSDITYLPSIHTTTTIELAKALRRTEEDVQKWQLKRGEFSAHVARMETEGIPLDTTAAHNLRNNIELAKEKLIQNLVDSHYPFFVRKKKRKGDLQGQWTDKYAQFEKYLYEEMDHTLVKNWKKTDSGRYCTDNDYLSNFDNIPAIYAYRQTRKLLNQLKWLRVPDEGKEDFFDSVGTDGHLRTFFGIYGTQTARNAPQAKKFIFAMSAWLRCLVKPPHGYIITELDYGSQEFAIGAILSQDPNMIEAYKSGDPYLYFAKKAGAVPPDGTKDKYKKERNLFKSTTLGLQYGMGYKALANKLTADMKEKITENKAQNLIQLHKRTYKKYWRWLDRLEREYVRKKYLQLPCGWALFGDNPQMLSVRNFPTQGAGSSIIREAVIQLAKYGINCIATLHDSCYILTPEDAGDVLIDRAERILKTAFDNVLNQNIIEIRIDRISHKHNETWISEKGEHFYNLLKEYLKPQETREDKIKKLMTGIYA